MNESLVEKMEPQHNILLKKKTLWSLRRGMLELECLFRRYFDIHFDDFTEQEKMIFIHFLEEEDASLWGWIFTPEERPAPLIYQALVMQLQSISLQV